MEGKFLYVFSQNDKDVLIKMGLKLLKQFPAKHIFVFIYEDNPEHMDFEASNIKFVLTNTLTF